MTLQSLGWATGVGLGHLLLREQPQGERKKISFLRDEIEDDLE
jgi:hypothetical protein